MTCWDILGIAPGVNKKLIKQTYAKLLKQTRPDDDPEGFKRLHEAYQQALKWSDIWAEEEEQSTTASVASQSLADWIEATDYVAPNVNPAPAIEGENIWDMPQEVVESPTPEPLSVAVELPAIIRSNPASLELVNASLAVILPTPASDLAGEKQFDPLESILLPPPTLLIDDIELETVSAEVRLQADWLIFSQELDEILLKPEAATDIKLWRFIEALPSLLDLEFRAAISERVFAQIAERNQQALQQHQLAIQAPVLNYLNGLFNWESQWQHLSKTFGSAQVDAVLPYLDVLTPLTPVPAKPRSVTMQTLLFYERVGAFCVDLGIMFLLLLGLALLGGGLDQDLVTAVMVLVGLLYWGLVIPLLEASSWQASPGKRLLGLKVVNRQGMRIPWYQAIWRMLMTVACLGAFKIVVWINFIIAQKKNMLLQDWLSRSYVIKR